MFVKFARNISTENTEFLPGLKSFVMRPLSEIRETLVEGNFELGMYSSVNRSQLSIGGGIAVSSYVSDTNFGPYAIAGSRVSIGGFEHPKDWMSVHCFQWGQATSHWDILADSQSRLEKTSKPPIQTTHIGPDCWIGNNATILSGVKVGAGAIIGAGSVVTKDIAPYAICVGNPARVIKFRFSESVIASLLELRWWELDINEIAKINFTDINIVLLQLEKIRLETK
jgi:acetyltransferase-like isoleucine patch superfamily enzyme